jgi:Domain of unknown function (DUF4105)
MMAPAPSDAACPKDGAGVPLAATRGPFAAWFFGFGGLAILALIALAATSGCATKTSAAIRDYLIPVPDRDATDRTASEAAIESGAPIDLDAYVDDLVARARELALAQDPDWRGLVHYRATWNEGWESEADGPNFFLARGGKQSPPLELEATLRAYFGRMPPDAPKDLQHPICQFPARLRWLSTKLAIDPRRLPKVECGRLDTFRKELEATAVTLVFSSYHANSPSSAFGHTFLRIHSARNGGAEKRDLLDFAIDFGARIDTQNAFIYGIKGLTGQFAGEFRRLPYFFKVREYADFDSRDIWNYTLDLTPDEIAMLVDHLWELGSTWFDYFYTSENCSYHVAGALEAAAPRLRTVGAMRWPVIPADTVKLLTAIPGAIKNVEYRPSLRSQFRQRTGDLSDEEKTAVARIADDPKAPMPVTWAPERQIRVLDAASDLVDVKFARELPFDLEGEGARRKQLLLERRASIPVVSKLLSVPMPMWQRPHLGHGSRRFGVLGGATAGVPSIYLDARLALHDLADPAPGYPQTSSLEFLPTRVRVYFPGGEDAPNLSLEHAYFVRASSMVPADRFERRMSWRFQVGAVNIDDAGCSEERCLVAQAVVGTGWAVASEEHLALGWLMIDTQLASGPHLQGFSDIPLRAAMAPTLGLRLRLDEELHVLTTASLWALPWQTPSYLLQAGLDLRWLLSRPVAVAAESRLESDLEAGTTTLRMQLGAYLYF